MTNAFSPLPRFWPPLPNDTHARHGVVQAARDSSAHGRTGSAGAYGAREFGGVRGLIVAYPLQLCELNTRTGVSTIKFRLSVCIR